MILDVKANFLAVLLAGALFAPSALTQVAQGKEPPGAPAAAPSPMPSPGPTAASPSIPTASRSSREAMMYRRLWGVDDLVVRETSSGMLIRFSYRVVDANKAKPLNDKKTEAYLVDEKSGAALQVPVMEKVGQLRQTATPENGREYWMVFSNKGHFVQPGSRVSVVIGKFRVDGLVVETTAPRPSSSHP